MTDVKNPAPQDHVDWQAIAEHYRFAMLEVERRISVQHVKEALPGKHHNETAKFISGLSHVLWEARQKVIFKEKLDSFAGDAPAPQDHVAARDLSKQLRSWSNWMVSCNGGNLSNEAKMAADAADFINASLDPEKAPYLHPPRGEPTPEMLLAGSMVDWSKYSSKEAAARDVWHAMVSNSGTGR